MSTERNKAIRAATNIHELVGLLTDDWYRASGRDFSRVPTWGPTTSAVDELSRHASESNELVSWDTTATDPRDHLFLICVYQHGQHSFEICRIADLGVFGGELFK